MRGFKLTQFEMLETILASDKEFIDAAVTGGTVQQREDLELLNQDGAGEGEGELVQGVRGPGGQLDVVPRAVRQGVQVRGGQRHDFHGGHHLGAGEEGEQAHDGSGHVVLVIRVDQGHDGAVAGEAGECVQGREVGSGWLGYRLP